MSWMEWKKYSDMLFHNKKRSVRNMVAVSYTHLDVYKRQGVDCDYITYIDKPTFGSKELGELLARYDNSDCLLYTSRKNSSGHVCRHRQGGRDCRACGEYRGNRHRVR